MSASLPAGTMKMATAMRKDVTIQASVMASTANSRPMVGRATLTAEPMIEERNEAIDATSRTTCLSTLAVGLDVSMVRLTGVPPAFMYTVSVARRSEETNPTADYRRWTETDGGRRRS